MTNIEARVLNPEVIQEAEKMMVCAARLTQRGHKVKDMDSFMALYDAPFTEKTTETMTKLPHPTIQKFGMINVAVAGASRRFLAQITRHQNEVKFMSASLQYSNYSQDAAFVVPYELLDNDEAKKIYLSTCLDSLETYGYMANFQFVDHDTAGYLMPQSLANMLIMSATPYQFKHMIAQRTCRRNTKETQYVMLRVWEQLYSINPILFSPKTTGPFCQQGPCKEGSFGCQNPIVPKTLTPTEIIARDFPLLAKKETN